MEGNSSQLANQKFSELDLDAPEEEQKRTNKRSTPPSFWYCRSMRSACYLLGTGEHVQYACFCYFYLAVVFVVASKHAVYLKEGREGWREPPFGQ